MDSEPLTDVELLEKIADLKRSIELKSYLLTSYEKKLADRIHARIMNAK